MGTRPWCFLSWLEMIEFGLPFVGAPSAHQFFRQIVNVVGTSHALDRLAVKLGSMASASPCRPSLQSVPVSTVSFQRVRSTKYAPQQPVATIAGATVQ